MVWTDDNWLRMSNSGNLAIDEVEGPNLEEHRFERLPERDDFDENSLRIDYYSPRISYYEYASTAARRGFLRIRGQESLSSLHKVSFVARKLSSVSATVTTRMEFAPTTYQHSAGLVIYYDHMDYVLLCKYYSQTLNGETLALIRLKNGERLEYRDSRVSVEEGRALCLRLSVRGRKFWFEWSYADGKDES